MNNGKFWTKEEREQLKLLYAVKPGSEKALSFAFRIKNNFPGRSEDSIRWMAHKMIIRGEIVKPEPDEAEMPSVLFMDIETAPMLTYNWDPKTDYITADKLIRDWYVICWSAMWWGDENIIGDCINRNEIPSGFEERRDDKRICGTLWRLFDDADIVIAQNGKKFDFLKMNSRWWLHGNFRPSSFKTIDTLQSARQNFGQSYNSLNELAAYLGIGRKLKTDMDLWRNCDHGNQDSLDRMQEYCGHDVELLRDVYEKMKCMIPNHPDFSSYSKTEGVCPVCLDVNIKRIGTYHAAVKEYAEFRCSKCGSVWHSRKAEKC